MPNSVGSALWIAVLTVILFDRAALEEEYGKKLLKLSKSPLGKDELGYSKPSSNSSAKQ